MPVSAWRSFFCRSLVLEVGTLLGFKASDPIVAVIE
jgi:hypothetical protein